jgi:uncharacterized protein
MKRNKQIAVMKREKGEELYERAQRAWTQEREKVAFRLFLEAAKMGEHRAFDILGSFYQSGYGVESNEREALYWYKRANRHGSWMAANNIGCIWRDLGNLRRARWWYLRAVDSGDANANLNLAKIYIRYRPNLIKAKQFLLAARDSRESTESAKEEARLLLRWIEKQQKVKAPGHK